MNKVFILALYIFASLVTACKNKAGNEPVDLEKDKQALLAMHMADRKAHFDTDANALFENSLDTFVWVGDAQIVHISKTDAIKRFEQNFSGATYSKWDNLDEPIIRISDDGTLAWMITKLEVRRTKKDESGEEVPEGFIYAGIMTYKKVGGKWLKEAWRSTRSSGETHAVPHPVNTSTARSGALLSARTKCERRMRGDLAAEG
jgi:hypothetical protein